MSDLHGPSNSSSGRSAPALATALAPAFSEGQAAYLSVDLGGNLRITGIGDGGTGNLGAVATAAAPTYGQAAQVNLSTDLAGNLRVIAANSAVALATASAPTYVQNAAVSLSTDLTGNLRVIGATSPAVATPAAPTYSANAAVHLSTDLAGNLRVISANSAVALATAAAPTYTQNAIVNLSTDLSGNLRVTGSTSPATATAAAPTYTPGAAVALSTDLSGNLRVIGTTSPAIATAAAPTYSASTAVSLSTDLSGNLRTLSVPAVASTTAPTYTNGQTGFLSMDLSGNLRVISTGNNGVQAYATSAAPTYVQNTTVNLSTDLAGNLRVTPKIIDTQTIISNITATDVASTTTTGQNNVSIISGTPTANSFVSQTISGQTVARVQVAGIWSGTLQLEGTIDGSKFVAMPARIVGTSYTGSSVTANGLFMIDVAGLIAIRVRSSAAMTGTANVSMSLTSCSGVTQILNPVRIVDNTSGTQVAIDTHRSLQAVIYDSTGNAVVYGQPTVTIPAIATASAPTYTGNANVSLSTDLAGNMRIVSSPNIFWNGASGANSALLASATYTGPTRDVGVVAGTPNNKGYFNAFVLTDQSGTAYIDCSNDNTNWYIGATSAITANAPLILTIPVMTEFHRVRVVNGGTNQTSLFVNSSYTQS